MIELKDGGLVFKAPKNKKLLYWWDTKEMTNKSPYNGEKERRLIVYDLKLKRLQIWYWQI